MPDTNVSSVLSTTSSFLISALITSSYVGGLYIAQSARLLFLKTSHQAGAQRIQKPVEWRRDDDEVIRARLQAAVLATCASCAIVYACVGLGYHDEDRWLSPAKITLRLIGLNLSGIGYRSILPNLLIPLLYCGPLTAQFLSSTLPLQRHWSYQENLRPIFTTWIGIRNHIVAPITEELVFRGSLMGISELSGKGLYHKLFFTPLWFGIAHLHHAYELYNKFGRTSSALTRAIVTCLVQLTYTTLFGAYASFLLLRCGSIIPAITAHITANIMGLPQLGWELRQHPKQKKLILAAYIIGIIGFALASDCLQRRTSGRTSTPSIPEPSYFKGVNVTRPAI